MNSWESLRTHIKSNYVVTDDKSDMLALVFDLEEGRRQAVFVRKLMLGDAEWAEIATPVCVESDITPRDLLERNAEFVVGGLALLRSGTVVYRHSLPLKDLDVDEFEVPFHLITKSGDKLEEEFTGADNF
jgi:hypothetical protein